MFTVLTGMPVPMTVAMKSGGGNAGRQDEDDAGATAQVIAAMEDFADRVDWPTLQAGMSEQLVNAIATMFREEGGNVLKELGSIVEQAEKGTTARDIYANFLFDNPADGTTAAGGDGAYRERFFASSKLQREFGSADTYVAYCRASHAGQVGICGATRKALASRAAPSRLAGRRTDPDDFAGLADAELEIVYAREYEDSRALQDEFKCVDSYIAYRRAQRRGLVQQAIPKAR